MAKDADVRPCTRTAPVSPGTRAIRQGQTTVTTKVEPGAKRGPRMGPRLRDRSRQRSGYRGQAAQSRLHALGRPPSPATGDQARTRRRLDLLELLTRLDHERILLDLTVRNVHDGSKDVSNARRGLTVAAAE